MVAARSSSLATSHNRQTGRLQKGKQSGLKKYWRTSTSAIGNTLTESNCRTSQLEVIVSIPGDFTHNPGSG